MKPKILIIKDSNNTDEKLAEAIVAAGGEPVLPNNEDRLEECLALANGVILADGNAFCGDCHITDAELCACDVCREKEIPLLGIGRGMQVINLYTGGNLTLKMQGEKNHKKEENGKTVPIHHTVSVTLDTFIAYDPFKTEVNSAHNQCLRIIGENVRVVAVAGDGVAEAIEHKKLPWFGVQWHPELMEGVCGDKIFEHFINVAKDTSTK